MTSPRRVSIPSGSTEKPSIRISGHSSLLFMWPICVLVILLAARVFFRERQPDIPPTVDPVDAELQTRLKDRLQRMRFTARHRYNAQMDGVAKRWVDDLERQLRDAYSEEKPVPPARSPFSTFLGFTLLLPCIAWAVKVFFFDISGQLTVTPSDIHIVPPGAIGAVRLDRDQATFHLNRDPALLHYLLGFGTGNILVRVGDGKSLVIPNVRRAQSRLRLINQLIGAT